ncbi:MAG TPA: hypothetical protein DEO32_00665 [Ruminococcaceae bacterium]|nr:hypothetical protein [Oscillospiraceae bacterium]
MLNSIFRFIKGNVDFEGSGKFPERFLNLTVRSGINLWNASPTAGGLRGSMAAGDYRKIRLTARKAGVRLKITKKRGLPFVAAKYRYRKGLLFGAAAGVALIIFLSSFVWTVEINGCENVSETRLLSTLAENGLYSGCFRNSLDTAKIKRRTLLEVPELGWLSVNLSSGKASVEVREKAKKPAVNTHQTPRNIISSADGVITGCNVRNGTLTVTRGSGVVKGAMLVSGVLATEQNTIRYVCADADIYADVNSVKEFTIPEAIKYNSLKENIAERKRFFMFNFSLPCSMAYQSFTNSAFTEKSENFILNSCAMPIGFKTETAVEIGETAVKLSASQAEKAAENRLALFEAFEKNESKTVSRDIKIKKDKNSYTCRAAYIFNENIANTVDFTVEEE